MSGGAVATTLGFAAILLFIVAIINWHEIQISREEERRAASVPGPVQHFQWPPIASCSTPARPLTIDQAHRAMQVHLECAIDHCGCKRAAQSALVGAGRMRLRVEFR